MPSLVVEGKNKRLIDQIAPSRRRLLSRPAVVVVVVAVAVADAVVAAAIGRRITRGIYLGHYLNGLQCGEALLI